MKMDHDSYYYDSQYQDDEADDFDDVEESRNEMSGDALLISLVRDHPYLYNKELTDFKDSIKKQNAWVEIANIMTMTVEECQSRWMRLRERYSREKKQRHEETTTGSGASKRKAFEFFDNMQFLERFVKRRRTMTNIHNIQNKSVCPVAGSSKLLKTMTNIHNMQNKSVLPVAESSSLEKNFGSHDEEKENNSSSVNATLNEQSLIKSNIDLTSTAQHVRDSLAPALHSNASDSSSPVSVSSHMQNKGLIGQRIKSRGKFQPDAIESAIGKVTSLLENRCVPVSSSSSSLKPEIEEDVAFCQLMLSLLVKMSACTKADKKKAVLRTFFDI